MFWKISKGAFVKDRCSMSFQIFSTGAFTETFKVSENSYFSDNLWITPDEFWTYESYSFSVTVVIISWSLSYSINQKWHNFENQLSDFSMPLSPARVSSIILETNTIYKRCEERKEKSLKLTEACIFVKFKQRKHDYLKSIRIWSFSCTYSVRMWETTDQKNSECGHFLSSAYYTDMSIGPCR